jgi:hypothetical protein
VIVIGQEHGKPEIDQTWLVFSRPVFGEDGRSAGHVEVGFSLIKDEDSDREVIQHVTRSPLVVFFPTVLETHLGFLLQGPYRTTPSRDNVPPADCWNTYLVEQTASVLVRALQWMRDHNLLDTAALRCLPIDAARFGESSMFQVLFTTAKQALRTLRTTRRTGMAKRRHHSGSNARTAPVSDARIGCR